MIVHIASLLITLVSQEAPIPVPPTPPPRHAESSFIHYSQQGKDCVVSYNGSARIERNHICPKQ